MHRRPLTALPTPLLTLLAVSAFASHNGPAATTATGLTIEYTDNVTCSRPTHNGDTIAVHYRGTLQTTGAVFDESYQRGAFKFTLGQHRVIDGWDQGLVDMCPGEKRKLIIPPELGYGDADMGVIPPGSTLVFETELVDIVGVEEEEIHFGTSPSQVATSSVLADNDGAFSIATAPSTPPPPDNNEHGAESIDPGRKQDTPPSPSQLEREQAECHLLGPFALLVQGALGVLALLTLVWKRYRETPKRPWRIWFFDVSKQVFGSMLLHVLNLAMSMLGSVDMDMVNAAASAGAANVMIDSEERTPNPCSFYLLNLGIDTTIGVPVLYILLKILHALFRYTPLAKPPESIKSGNYSTPPKLTWYLKQLFIYCIGLFFMKLFVLFLFAALPWLPWVGDWALRWTQGNDALQITFALFIFPLAMNAVQYWVIDNFIMDKQHEVENGGYEAVRGDDADGEGQNEEDEEATLEDFDAVMVGKGQMNAEETLKEAKSTPIPQYTAVTEGGEGGGRSTPYESDDRDGGR